MSEQTPQSPTTPAPTSTSAPAPAKPEWETVATYTAYADAQRWFEVYLHERPNAPLAREARGRLMEALVRTGERARAESLAEQYLGLHPDGPHAKLARQLVQH